MLYTIWQNSSTTDTYYSCSDVVLTGGGAASVPAQRTTAPARTTPSPARTTTSPEQTATSPARVTTSPAQETTPEHLAPAADSKSGGNTALTLVAGGAAALQLTAGAALTLRRRR
jgi:chitin-binding protein